MSPLAIFLGLAAGALFLGVVRGLSRRRSHTWQRSLYDWKDEE